jgi:hypothetical protein
MLLMGWYELRELIELFHKMQGRCLAHQVFPPLFCREIHMHDEHQGTKAGMSLPCSLALLLLLQYPGAQGAPHCAQKGKLMRDLQRRLWRVVLARGVPSTDPSAVRTMLDTQPSSAGRTLGSAPFYRLRSTLATVVVDQEEAPAWRILPQLSSSLALYAKHNQAYPGVTRMA